MSNELKDAMDWLAKQPDTIFIGQGLTGGTRMSESFKDVPAEKVCEFPVAEELQLGVSIGLALEDFVPISVFPRWNFLLCAANQLVNHLDKLPALGYRPQVIIRVGGGSTPPLDAGPQHTGDYTNEFGMMFHRTKTVRVREGKGALGAYKTAYADKGYSTVITEA